MDGEKTAALAVTILDWKVAGAAYAMLVGITAVLASVLDALGVPDFAAGLGATTSHRFAATSARYVGSKREEPPSPQGEGGSGRYCW